MQWVRMFIIGLIVGVIARFIYPAHVPLGLLASAILGILGSYLAGFIGRMVHPASASSSQPFHPAGILYSIIGSLILIFIGRTLHIV